MSQRFLFSALCISILVIPSADCWARGGGGGGRGGGGGGGGFSGGASRGGGGGGMSGGARPSPGPSMSGGARPSPGPSMSGGARPAQGNIGRAGSSSVNRAPGGAGAGQAAAGKRPATGAATQGGAGNRAAAAQGGAANRAAAPNKNQLNSFLGLPSDEGLSHAGTASASAQRQSAGSNFDVNTATKQGPGGGQAAGVTVTGPQGNTVGKAGAVGAQGGTAVAGGVQNASGATAARGAAVGPQGGAAVKGGVQGSNGATAARGAAVGPGGQAVAARGAVGPGGYGGGGAVTSGPAGVGAGFTRMTPSGRYTAATAVRGNYNNWGIYGQGWNAQYPGAWVAAGLTATALWSSATWGTASSYCGYSEEPPIYYDYGTSVVYEDENVYVNGESAGTTEQYYDQASTIAASGAQAEAPPDADWLPLGVFAFTQAENPNSDITIQLAINREGIIRGNYTDSASKQNQVIQGALDKQTQRAAFTVGENKTSIIETGMYNLTKDEAPCLVHIGKDETQQWLLVRLQNPETSTPSK